VAWEIRLSRCDCSVRKQHGIQRQGQDFDLKCLYLEGYTAKRLTDEFAEKAGQRVVLISRRKSCRTQAQLTGGQAAADCAVPALKKTLRQLMI